VADAPKPTTTAGVSAADFLADPAKAVADLRAEIRREIITSNIVACAILYLIIEGKRGGGL
jgi:hypothetical protein